METEQQRIRNEINARNQKISAGVSVQDKERTQREIVELEEQLRNLEQPQELPPEEEVKTEPILSTVDGLPLAVFAKNEDAAILIQCEAESIVERLNKAHVVVVGGLNSKLHIANELELELRQRNAELERDYELSNEELQKLSQEYSELESDNQQLTLERDEALKYRDNAVQQLEDMAFELEQNRIELNRNREVRALTEAERTAEQEAARQRFLDSRIKIYNPRNADELNSRERIANLAETGEEITYLAIYEKGTYVEITEDEALAIQAMNAPVEIPEVTEAEIFQPDASTEEIVSELQPTTDGSDNKDQQSTVGSDAEEAVAETFEEEVRRRLNTLELKVNKNEPEFYHEVA